MAASRTSPRSAGLKANGKHCHGNLRLGICLAPSNARDLWWKCSNRPPCIWRMRSPSRGGTGRAPERGAGDLYVHIDVPPHPRFQRPGYDLVHELHVPHPGRPRRRAVLDTLDGTEQLSIPPWAKTGRVFRFLAQGVPHLDGRGRGELRVQVVVDTPTDLSPSHEVLLRQLAEPRAEAVKPPDTSIRSQIRSAFK